MLEKIFSSSAKWGETWSDSTFYLYIFIFISVTIFAFLSENTGYFIVKTKKYIYIPKQKINIFFFLSSYLVASFFLIFRDVGMDLVTYRDIFSNANSTSIESYYIEPGYYLLNNLLHSVTDNEYTAISLISFILINLIFITIWKYSKFIDVGCAICAFIGMFYFQSFSLLRIYLASFILLFTFPIIEKGYKKYIVSILVTTFIHYSAIVMLIPIGSYWIYKNKKKLFWIFYILLFITFYYISDIFSLINIARYAHYSDIQDDKYGLGFGQFILHIPLVLFYYYIKIKYPKQKEIDLLLIYILYSLFFGLIGYKSSIIGRISTHFSILYIIIIPYFIHRLKDYNDHNFQLIKALYILYISFRLYLYFKEYLYLDGIMPYKNYLIN